MPFYPNYGPYPNYPNQMIPQQQNIMPVAQQTDERIWVQNETAADSYLVAPGGFVRLWDNSKNKYYEKRADNSGRPFPMEVYEYRKITSNPVEEEEQKIDYMNEINALKERITALEKRGKTNGPKSNGDNTTA
jgi:hypothetical protein